MAGLRGDSSSSRACDVHVQLLALGFQREFLDRRLHMEIAEGGISVCRHSPLASVWALLKSQRSLDSFPPQTSKPRTHCADSTIRKPLRIPQPHLREI